MSDEGFGRNLRKVFGADSDYHDMGGRPLAGVTLDDSKERLTFTFKDGTEAVFGVEGDCCSHSWIEHLEVPADIEGQELVAVEDDLISRDDDASEYECLQVYNTKFRTSKGETITLEYRNTSNGYYGGYLVRVA